MARPKKPPVPEPGDVLIDVTHGSRLCRAWLGAFQATANESDDAKARPALYRTLLVEAFPTGFRFSSTDSYWLAVAWCGNLIDPEQPGEYHLAPERGELPWWQFPIRDTDLRIAGFMQWVRAATKPKKDAPLVDLPLRVTLRADHDDDVPRLDPQFDITVVDVEVPGTELVTGALNEVGYPQVQVIMWANDPDDSVELDHVQLNPHLLRRLAASCTAIGSSGLRFDFHGDPARPISWEAVQPADAELVGVIMPQRVAGSDE